MSWPAVEVEAGILLFRDDPSIVVSRDPGLISSILSCHMVNSSCASGGEQKVRQRSFSMFLHRKQPRGNERV